MPYELGHPLMYMHTYVETTYVTRFETTRLPRTQQQDTLFSITR